MFVWKTLSYLDVQTSHSVTGDVSSRNDAESTEPPKRDVLYPWVDRPAVPANPFRPTFNETLTWPTFCASPLQETNSESSSAPESTGNSPTASAAAKPSTRLEAWKDRPHPIRISAKARCLNSSKRVWMKPWQTDYHAFHELDPPPDELEKEEDELHSRPFSASKTLLRERIPFSKRLRSV
jgi:hypothetical protein